MFNSSKRCRAHADCKQDENVARACLAKQPSIFLVTHYTGAHPDRYEETELYPTLEHARAQAHALVLDLMRKEKKEKSLYAELLALSKAGDVEALLECLNDNEEIYNLGTIIIHERKVLQPETIDYTGLE